MVRELSKTQNTIMCNEVKLTGFVGKDPDISFHNDTPRASFSLATSHTSGDHNIVSWHKIVAWGALDQYAEAMVTKGSKITVHGRLGYREGQAYVTVNKISCG